VTVYARKDKAAMFTHITKFFDKFEDGKLDLVRKEDRRTPGQQSLLHILIREIAIYVGVGELEMKENILKRNSEGVFPYWPHSIEETLKKRYKAKAHKTGYVIPGLVPKPESKLTKNEEIELIDRLYQLGAEWGVEFSDIAEQTAARREQVA